ncbi:hypothetical protein GR925_27255 [Streptomyces sp. HUCO-GS316]|uniref:WhiB family transcriptional regulator n=1 Tax=Streptomyces sp. HUCO-GS316 TaxID=2692198 RepID=UPI001370E04F|nr:WhiB family transcriptional regulator [Streptomyces sp. HUCO-GS316]MXM67026.1 hypothetical protein [Streptomyces sp. HUCO-GS316]
MRSATAPRSGREWELSAACRHEDAELWFSRRTQARAMEICTACPVRVPCRAAVLQREEGLPKSHRGGIVAGLTGPQRYDLERRVRRPPQPPDPTAPVPAGDRPRREPAPCGTRAAYQRHLRRREPVDDACRAANALSAGHYRRTGSTRRQAAGPAQTSP